MYQCAEASATTGLENGCAVFHRPRSVKSMGAALIGFAVAFGKLPVGPRRLRPRRRRRNTWMLSMRAPPRFQRGKVERSRLFMHETESKIRRRRANGTPAAFRISDEECHINPMPTFNDTNAAVCCFFLPNGPGVRDVRPNVAAARPFPDIAREVPYPVFILTVKAPRFWFEVRSNTALSVAPVFCEPPP